MKTAPKSNAYAKGPGSGKGSHSFENPHAHGSGSMKRGGPGAVGKAVKSKRTKC